jgi:hypothetical protein
MKDSLFGKFAKVASCDIFSANVLNLFLKALMYFFKLIRYGAHSHEI